MSFIVKLDAHIVALGGTFNSLDDKNVPFNGTDMDI